MGPPSPFMHRSASSAFSSVTPAGLSTIGRAPGNGTPPTVYTCILDMLALERSRAGASAGPAYSHFGSPGSAPGSGFNFNMPFSPFISPSRPRNGASLGNNYSAVLIMCGSVTLQPHPSWTPYWLSLPFRRPRSPVTARSRCANQLCFQPKIWCRPLLHVCCANLHTSPDRSV